MRTIWKFAVQPVLEMPAGAKVVHVESHVDADLWKVCHTLWCEVDTDAPMIENRFDVVGTGWDLSAGQQHVVTWLADPFVWHLYRTERMP